MTNRKQFGTQPRFESVTALFVIGLLFLATCLVRPTHAQATSPSASATAGAVTIGTGNFTAYKPPHNRIIVGDSVQEPISGNLSTGTDASGKECTLDPNQPPPSWSWTSATTYSSDNTNYVPDTSISVGGGQNATLFGSFGKGGYYSIAFQGHVDFYTSCASGKQHLDTSSYSQSFSVSKPDFDFSVTDIAVNQGESGIFTSTLSSIDNFAGPISFSNSDGGDPLFGVSGSGNAPGTAPITITVDANAQVGSAYPVGVRGSSTVGNTTLYHDHTANVTVLKRQAWITYGPTYYKKSDSTPGLNFEGPGPSTGQADTVYANNPMTFSPHYTGFWNQNCTYNWGGDVGALSGSFNPAAIPSSSGFTPAPAPVTAKSVALNLVDGKYGASSAYTIHYHKPVEEWKENTAASIIHPTPTNGPTDPYAPGEWRLVGPYPNNGPAGSGDAKGTFTQSNDQEFTVTGTIGAQQGLSIDGQIVKAQFQLTESIAIGASYKTGTVQSYEYTVPPGYNVWIFWGIGYEEHSGTCDYYDATGYRGSYAWASKFPQGGPTTTGAKSGQAAIRFAKLAKPLR